MAGTRAKARKDASSLWVLEATAAIMQQSADKGQTAHGSDLHLFRSMRVEVWDTRRRSKTRCQRKESSPQHSSPNSRPLF
jgi:hypothetical protein